MARANKRCVHCGDAFEQNPRIKDHRYCNKGECQKARRALWQREKFRKDPEYKENQQMCWKEWYALHPGYYKQYRKKNLQYTEKNRQMQRQRNVLRRKNGRDKVIAKMDLITSRLFSRRGIPCRIVVNGRNMIAKMDSIAGKLLLTQ